MNDNAERRMTAGQTAISQVGEVVSHYSHKVKDGGSSPPPATKINSYGQRKAIRIRYCRHHHR